MPTLPKLCGRAFLKCMYCIVWGLAKNSILIRNLSSVLSFSKHAAAVVINDALYTRTTKETPRRSIMVTLSLNEISTNKLGNIGWWTVVRGGRRYSACLRPAIRRDCGQIFKDDDHV